MALRNAPAALVQSRAERARSPRPYSSSALGAAGALFTAGAGAGLVMHASTGPATSTAPRLENVIHQMPFMPPPFLSVHHG